MPTGGFEHLARQICEQEGLTYGEPVGAGAFKQTFQVTSPSGELQALKVYRPGTSLVRAGREVEAMKRCTHPGIARILQIGTLSTDEGITSFSIEQFIPGGTLADRLREEGVLGRAELLLAGRLLIEAVAHVASQRLVHRDIKPENVMLMGDRRTPVIVDFGLVRDLNAVSVTPTWAMQGPGTPLYAPLEQLQNRKELIDWRADQYSLGVLLSYCAFGFHPYEDEGARAEQVVERVNMRGEQTLRFRAAADRAGLSALIRMTEVWPVRRYRTTDNLVEAWRQL